MNADNERTSLLARRSRASSPTPGLREEAGSDNNRRRWQPAYVIMIVSLLEKVCLIGIRANLVQFLEYHGYLNWTTTEATIVALLCTKLTLIGAVFSGVLADSYLGRYRVLSASLLLQFLGASCLCAASVLEEEVTEDDKYVTVFNALVIVGLVLFGIGMGGAFGTEIPLGIDQYTSAEQLTAVKHFFPMYYWSTNVGCLVAQSAVSIAQVNWRVVGYALPPVFSLLSIGVLFGFRNHLQRVPAGEKPMSEVLRVCREAISSWRRSRQTSLQSLTVNASEQEDNWAADVTAPWIKYAERSYGGAYSYSEVSKVHNFLAVLSILAATIFYQVIMDQTTTSFTSQGNLMQLPVVRDVAHENSTVIPPSVLASFNPLAILLAIPLLYAVVYPLCAKVTNGLPPSAISRIYVGMGIAFLAISMATVVEVERRRPGRWNWLNTTDRLSPGDVILVSDMSIFYQIPQYMLSGVAEVLSFLSVLELAYSYSPTNMKGMCIGLVYAFQGVSAMLSIGIVAIIHHSKYGETLFFQNRSPGAVHYYFMILGGVILIGMLLFALAARRFKTVRVHVDLRS